MSREVMKLALEALETLMIERGSVYHKAIIALRKRLAQPEQEPDLSMREPSAIRDRLIQAGWTPPAQQPLTEAAIRGMCERVPDYDISTHDLIQFARAIERAHGIKEKNT